MMLKTGVREQLEKSKFIPISEPSLTPLEREYVLEAIDSGWVSSQGEFILRFEEQFARWHDLPHAVACSNCTTALHLAVDVFGIGPGDEVLCPDLTFIAPANMIRLTGAKPVLVDIEPVTWAIDPQAMERKITPRTKAVIVVHPFGHAADMDPIMEIATRNNLKVIEDVAEAPGGRYKGKLLGTFGDLACYSFYANKVITTGEGGMVMTRDPGLDKALRVKRDHGMSRERRYIHEVVGFNYRMTNLQAAIGLAQMERFEKILAHREDQARRYAARLADVPTLSWRPSRPWCDMIHWMATVSLRNADLRAPLLAYLKEQGIDCREMVYPIHSAAPYADTNDPSEFPVSRDVSLRSLHLPSSTDLPEADLQRVCDELLGWLEEHDRA
jgi:perosamine synthetase